MHSKINQLKLGVILSYISRIVQIVVGLVYTPIMIRLLGQSEYGLYNIAASTIAYLGVLNFGFGSAYMRFYSRYKVQNDRENIAVLNGMFLIIFSILGMVSVLGGVGLIWNIDVIFGPSLSIQELSIARILIIILIINLAVSFPVIIFNTFLQANEKFVFQNAIQIIRQITTPLVVLPILLMGYGSVGMVIVTVSINIIIELSIIYYAIKKIDMRFSFYNFDKGLLREMIIYSSYIFMNMIVDQVNSNMDKTILGRFQGTVSVAIYSLGANLRIYYQQISTAVSNVFTPRIHRMVAKKSSDEELTLLFTRIGRIQFILLSLVLSGFIFYGRPFITLWAGTDYIDSYPIALLLMISLAVPLIQNIGIEIQRAKNMHQFRSWLYLFMAVGNLIVSIPLSEKYGGIGAAFGTTISLIISNGIVMNWYNHNKIGLNMIFFWKEILKFIPVFILPVLYGLFTNSIINLYNLNNLVIYGSIYIIIFLLSMWFFGMNQYEKNILLNPLK